MCHVKMSSTKKPHSLSAVQFSSHFLLYLNATSTYTPARNHVITSVSIDQPLCPFSLPDHLLCNPVLLVQPSCPCLSCCDYLPVFYLTADKHHPSFFSAWIILTCSYMKKNMKKNNNQTICICIFWIPLLNWLDSGGPREWVPMSRFNQIEFR